MNEAEEENKLDFYTGFWMPVYLRKYKQVTANNGEPYLTGYLYTLDKKFIPFSVPSVTKIYERMLKNDMSDRIVYISGIEIFEEDGETLSHIVIHDYAVTPGKSCFIADDFIGDNEITEERFDRETYLLNRFNGLTSGEEQRYFRGELSLPEKAEVPYTVFANSIAYTMMNDKQDVVPRYVERATGTVFKRNGIPVQVLLMYYSHI